MPPFLTFLFFSSVSFQWYLSSFPLWTGGKFNRDIMPEIILYRNYMWLFNARFFYRLIFSIFESLYLIYNKIYNSDSFCLIYCYKRTIEEHNCYRRKNDALNVLFNYFYIIIFKIFILNFSFVILGKKQKKIMKNLRKIKWKAWIIIIIHL